MLHFILRTQSHSLRLRGKRGKCWLFGLEECTQVEYSWNLSHSLLQRYINGAGKRVDHLIIRLDDRRDIPVRTKMFFPWCMIRGKSHRPHTRLRSLVKADSTIASIRSNVNSASLILAQDEGWDRIFVWWKINWAIKVMPVFPIVIRGCSLAIFVFASVQLKPQIKTSTRMVSGIVTKVSNLTWLSLQILASH